MARIPTLGTTTSVAGAPAEPGSKTDGSALDGVDVDQFLTLLITELQNQDPLEPMDNSQLLSQIGQIREIGSNDQLTKTLKTVQMGQNMSTASSLIGREIRALSDSLEEVQGVVEKVTVGAADEGSPIRVHIGDAKISLTNIRSIVG